jgi:hypothetical protein
MDGVTRWQQLRQQWLASDQLPRGSAPPQLGSVGGGSGRSSSSSKGGAPLLPGITTSSLLLPHDNTHPLLLKDAEAVADVLGRCWSVGAGARKSELDVAGAFFEAALAPNATLLQRQPRHYFEHDHCDALPPAPTSPTKQKVAAPKHQRDQSAAASPGRASGDWRRQVQRRTDMHLQVLRAGQRQEAVLQQHAALHAPGPARQQQRGASAAAAATQLHTQLCLARLKTAPLHKTGAQAVLAEAQAAVAAAEREAAAAKAAAEAMLREAAEVRSEAALMDLARQLQAFHRSRAASRVLQEWRAAAAESARREKAAAAQVLATRTRAIVRGWLAAVPKMDAAAIHAAERRCKVACDFHRLYRIHSCAVLWHARASERAEQARALREQEAAAEQRRLMEAQQDKQRELIADRFRRLHRMYGCFTGWRRAAAVAAEVRRLHPDVSMQSGGGGGAVGQGQRSKVVAAVPVQQQPRAAPRPPPPPQQQRQQPSTSSQARQRLLSTAAKKQRVLFEPSAAADAPEAAAPVVLEAAPAVLPISAAAAASPPAARPPAPAAAIEAVESVQVQLVPHESPEDAGDQPPQQDEGQQDGGQEDPEAAAAPEDAAAAQPPPPQQPAAAARKQQLERERCEREAQRRLRALRAQLAASQLALARAHYERCLVTRWGMGGWTALVGRVREQIRRAEGWRAERVARQVLGALKDAFYRRRWRAVRREVEAFGVLRGLRREQLLRSCLHGLSAWAAAGSFRRRGLAARAVAGLRAAVARRKEGEARAAEHGRAALRRRALAAWRKGAEDQVGLVCFGAFLIGWLWADQFGLTANHQTPTTRPTRASCSSCSTAS